MLRQKEVVMDRDETEVFFYIQASNDDDDIHPRKQRTVFSVLVKENDA